jgi:hypothetical protein
MSLHKLANGQPVYRLIFLKLSPRLELRTLAGYSNQFIHVQSLGYITKRGKTRYRVYTLLKNTLQLF